MWQILRQIVRTGIVGEPPPALDAALQAEARRIHDELLAILGQALAIRQVDAGSCNGCELEIPRAQQPVLQHRGAGHPHFVASRAHCRLVGR